MVIRMTQTFENRKCWKHWALPDSKKEPYQSEILLFWSLWDFERTRRESNWTLFHKLCVLLKQTLQRISALKCSNWWRQGQWQTAANVFAWIWAFKANTHP